MNSFSIHYVKFLIFLLVFAVSLSAQAESRVEPSPWKVSVSAGAHVTDGNSDTSLFTFQSEATFEKNNDIWRFEGEHRFGEEDSETNVDASQAVVEYKRLISERTFIGLGTDFRRDEPSDLRYRVLVNPVVGHFLEKSDQLTFLVEAGPSYLFEEQGGERNDSLAPRIKERLEWKFSETAKLFQEVGVTFSVKDGDDYLVDGEAGLEAALTTVLSLVVSVEDHYDNVPAAGKERNDIAFLPR